MTGLAPRGADDKVSTFVSDDPNKCISDFLQSLEKLAREVYGWNTEFSRQAAIRTEMAGRQFREATACCYCRSEFTEGSNKHWDHDHLSGEFRGAACADCNMKARLKRSFLPVVFHNFKGYDLHLMMSSALGLMEGWKISVIPLNPEQFLSMKIEFKIGEYESEGKIKPLNFTIQFIDSNQFLNASLSQLIKNLPEAECRITSRLRSSRFPLLSSEVLFSKGVFPYDYLKNSDVLKDAVLPSQESFYNALTKSHCTNSDYEHAQRAWREFQVSNLKEYMLCYLELDIRQLADIFENFRKISMQEDGLDPVHFISTPGLSFASALKSIKSGIELLTDAQMYSLFERGIRGGMSFVNIHKVQATSAAGASTGVDSNEDVDGGTPTIHAGLTELLAVDANNLYGQALTMNLPVGGFRWLDDDELLLWTEDRIRGLKLTDPLAYLFDVDLEYPPEIHETTEDLPFAPEKAARISGNFLNTCSSCGKRSVRRTPPIIRQRS
ncbi:hypothetical protein BOX15_Mlig020163g11 [Macrostomum lignano]|uniref:DNA-directed DNA polymerase n=1 Tax=Macrostomum lignano TaxID=282301 RepID=A0A267FMM4_9PLAT|nr:hypothetical protein BOX15_Mlig020163g11 [Macrostomum lignano]